MTIRKKAKILDELVAIFKECIDNWIENDGSEKDTFEDFENMVTVTACIQFETIDIPEEVIWECMHDNCSVSGELEEILKEAIDEVRGYWKYA